MFSIYHLNHELQLACTALSTLSIHFLWQFHGPWTPASSHDPIVEIGHWAISGQTERVTIDVHALNWLVVMICHCRASLSKQQTDLLLHHTSRYLGITRANNQDRYCWLSFTVKSWAEFLTLISAICAQPLHKATSITVVICTACGQPAVNDL